MSFLAPLAALIGLLAVPIILLYMLRLRRREIQVSSTMLWQMLLRDQEANAPWQRLRRNLLLLLQLLILAALALALMRPYSEVPILTSGRIALLIDASASMNAIDVNPSRFEAAKARALEIVGGIRPEDSVAVVRVASGPEMLENYTNDQTRLRDAVNRMQPSTTPADWDAALTLAAAGAQGAEKFTIIILGDGGLPTRLDLTTYGDVRFIPIGTSGQNTAIIALATSTDPFKGAQLYAQIANYGDQPTEVIFSLNLDGTLFKAEPYTLAPNSTQDVIVTDLPSDFSQVEAVLTRPTGAAVQDYLPSDDKAWAVFSSRRAGRAVILTQGNPFLEQGFASFPDWQVFQGEPTQGLPAEAYELYVFDNWMPAVLPDANLLFVNPPEGIYPIFTVGQLTTETTLKAVRPDDPRTLYLKFNDVNVREFHQISGVAWADTLVEAEGGPLVLAGEYEGRRVAIITFDLYESDLPLKIAYPILLANLTAWYESPRTIRVEDGLHPDQTLFIQPLANADQMRIIRPDGTSQTLSVDNPPLIYADTDLSGIYTVESLLRGTVIQSEAFAVNLFDPTESFIKPQTPATGTGDIAAAGGGEIGQQEYWGWIAAAALAILILEWTIHHRRQQAPRLRSGASKSFARGR
ncbi:hypothetical protein ANRL4_00681 [Anaerolineae bacterium]|nr:hypothetical protein ANRL4_00681 [Anaerolineae bacterium]